MQSAWAKQKAFTIVELLIVIVVIAILAAITIVAYNGIQDRAKASAAQAAAKQASTKIQAYLVENAENYPASPAAAGLSTTSGTTYEYRYDNAANPKTFCLTATTNNVSYYISNTTTTPTAGACSGHGVNGVAAITNLVTNPSLESSATGWGGVNSASCSRTAAAALVGSYGMRCTTTSGSDSGVQINAPTLTGGTTYTALVSIRSQTATVYEYHLSVQGTAGSSGRQRINLGNGQSALYIYTWTPQTSGSVAFYALRGGGQGTGSATFDIDGAMIVEGSVSAYADGSSPGWTWNGTADNSTSTGPPL